MNSGFEDGLGIFCPQSRFRENSEGIGKNRIFAAISNSIAMRFKLSLIAIPFFFISCRTDVDMFTGFKESPIVYALLDADADTNYVIIKRAFLSEDAPSHYFNIPDSLYYPWKLDVRLVEYVDNEKSREIVLDTITQYDKEPGIFPNLKHLVYYTTESLHGNTASHNYSYQLLAVVKGDTIKAKTRIVGGNGFEIWSRTANFSVIPDMSNPKKVFFYPAKNAAIYQLSASFTFREQRGEGNDSVPRTMYWDLGTCQAADLNLNSDGLYQLNYSYGAFYTCLRNFLGADTIPIGIKRFIGDWPVTFYICAGGREIEEYNILAELEENGALSQLNYNPIEGGNGLVSSRCFRIQRARLAGTTLPELIDLGWGFKFSGGE